MKVMKMNVNNDKLYELVKTLRKYASALVDLNDKDANKLDSSDWQSCILDIAASLAVIEILIRMERITKNESIGRS